jgi:hypothetical protein
VLLAWSLSTSADETDQFIAWDVQLADSSGPINTYLNTSLRDYLAYRNNAIEPPCECEALTVDYLDYIFKGRLTARFKEFIRHNDDIDVYPPRSVSNLQYNRMSIYRGLVFPYVLPMSPTLRIGEVYLGDDKLGHFFGWGKRYYRRFLNLRPYEENVDDAVDRVIRWGVMSENTIVGIGVDGIFSHADLEANYQGFRMARNFCEGDAPYLVHEDSGWRLSRDIDIRDYVNPYFDESYNPPHFWGRRRGLVLSLIYEEYAHRTDHPLVVERFKRYSKSPPSRSVLLIRDFFLERGRAPQRDQVFAALSLPPDYPILALANAPVP